MDSEEPAIAQFGDDFECVCLLRRGGTGTVFRARDRRLGRSVVIKALDAIALDAGERAVAEARAQASVCWHANVLTLLAEGVSESGWPFLVLEDAEGGSLTDRVTSGGTIKNPELLEVANQLASALAAAHEAEIVHCDLKPSNVLFARDGSVRLSDFGAAHSSATHTLDLLRGSLLFAPPELLEGRRPSLPNDVYGLAVTLYFAVTGNPPFGDADQPAATTIARVHSERLRFDDLGLPPRFAELLDRCAAKDPLARPPMSEVVATLEADAAFTRSVGEAGIGSNSDAADVVRQVMVDRRRVVDDLLAVLGESYSAVDLTRTLIYDLSRESAEAMLPLLELASSRCPDLTGRTFTLEEVQRLVVAQLLTEIVGGPKLLYQGVGDYVEPSGPMELRQSMRDYARAFAWAKSEVPEAVWEMGPRYEERIWQLLGRVSDPALRAEFFVDSRSFDLFDPEMLSLILRVALPFFETLLADNFSWLFELMRCRPDLRQMFAFEHPAVLLEAVEGVDSDVRALIGNEWVSELEVGFLRLSTWERSALRTRFAVELEALGVEL